MARKKDEIKEIIKDMPPVKAIDAAMFSGLPTWILPIIQIVLGTRGSDGKIDIEEILRLLGGAAQGSFNVTPRSLYDLMNEAILDKKIDSFPEMEACITVLRDKIIQSS